MIKATYFEIFLRANKMINFYQSNKRKLIIASIFSSLLILEGCDKKEESAEEHLQKGIDYINKGEFEKARLELKTSSDANKDTAETYYYLALIDEKSKNFRGMKENLLRTIELAPNYTEARLKLGRVLLLFGEAEAALQQAEFILKDKNQNLDALTLKASAFIRGKRIAEALPIIDDILKLKPDHAEALGLKALVHMEKDDFDTAFALLNEAKKADSKNIALDVFKIHMDAKTKNVEAVVHDYENLVSSYPDNAEFKTTLAKIYTQTGKINEAEKILRDLIKEEPNKVDRQIALLDFLSVTAKAKLVGQFQEFVEQHKDQPRLLLELTTWMINTQKNYNETRAALDRVIELEENSIVGLTAKTVIAKIAFENKKFDEATKIVDEMLDANPNYDDAKILQAKLFLVKEQYDEAITLLNKVVWSSPNSQETLLLLGQTFLIKGDAKQADKYFKDVLAINPANLQALTYVYDKAVQNSEISYAMEILEKALNIMPENISILEKFAKLNIMTHDWEKAKTITQQIASSTNPLAADVANYFMAQILQGQGNCAKAVDLYKELLAKFPENSGALGNLASCYESMNKRSEIISFLNDLLAKKPQNVSASILQSNLLLMDKQFDKGATLLSNLIKSNPNVPQLYASLAEIKLAQHDNNAAILIYQDGLKENKDSIKLSLALASVYEKQNNYDAAITVYDELLRKNPNLDIASNNLALLLSEHYANPEQLKKAVLLAEKFKDSDQLNFKDTYAWVLVKQGSFREAVSILTAVTIAAPDVATFRYHLAVAHYKNDNRGSAISELKQAIELGKKPEDFPEKKAAEALLAELTANH